MKKNVYFIILKCLHVDKCSCAVKAMRLQLVVMGIKGGSVWVGGCLWCDYVRLTHNIQ